RDFAQVYKTQASRGGLTPHQPAIPRQGGYLQMEDAARRQQKGFPMITRRNCLIAAPAALICAPATEPETSWRSGVCRLNAPIMACAIGYESIAFKLRGGALIHAVDEGLLRHIPQAKLDYDIGRWSTLEV